MELNPSTICKWAQALEQLCLPPETCRVRVLPVQSHSVWHRDCGVVSAPGRTLRFCARFVFLSCLFFQQELYPKLCGAGGGMGSHTLGKLPAEGGRCETHGWSPACRSASAPLLPTPCLAAHEGWGPHSHTGRSCQYENQALLKNKW